MLKGYIKIAIRNIIKNKLHTFISVTSIALAIGCLTLAYTYIDSKNSYNAFHEDADKIYSVLNVLGKTGGDKLWGPTPLAVGPTFEEDFPEVTDSTRLVRRSGTVKMNDYLFNEQFYFVDNNFLEFFTFPLIKGNEKTFKGTAYAFISEDYAVKYFGDDEPVGKVIHVRDNENYSKSFTVQGVVDTSQPYSSINFDILLPHNSIKGWHGLDDDPWENWAYNFIKVENEQGIAALRSRSMDKYLEIQNEAVSSWPVREFRFEPITQLMNNGYLVTANLGGSYSPSSSLMLIIFSILIMILACFNYVNIGVVISTRRLKEIGIRKVIGTNRRKIILQFFIEHFFICAVALIIGIIIADLFILPFFSSIFGGVLTINLLHNHGIQLFYLITLLATTLAAGTYPALYVSKFKPITILRNKEKIGGGTKLSHAFLVFQFIITFIMISVAVVTFENQKYNENRDFGFQMDLVYNIPVLPEQYEPLNNELAKQPGISKIAGTMHTIGNSYQIKEITHHGENYVVDSLNLGPEYIDLMKLRLKEGRLFDKTFLNDRKAMIVNDKLVKALGWKNPLDQEITLDDHTYRVIGVVEDFQNRQLTEPVNPTVLRLAQKEDYRYITAIIGNPQNALNVEEEIQETWKKLFPDSVFSGYYQERLWDGFFREIRGVTKFTSFLAVVCLIISCSGLFGLISLLIVKRRKEIGVRKVLGADELGIVNLLNRNIFITMGLASLIALPLSYYFVNWYLNLFNHSRTDVTLVSFALSGIIMTFIAILTVSSQMYKAARTNIVKALKEE